MSRYLVQRAKSNRSEGGVWEVWEVWGGWAEKKVYLPYSLFPIPSSLGIAL
ncbi:MAG: hypothetical protein F6J90_26265 [Moorea sp. SIOASIH]|uniref:hypothetical protein n=1 Tax=Moorena sp. SIOASIH TaxID=2607817 RepID=UPI0013B96934|nr:hypothetical protein [Moorena sp. SIOASIH]NEO39646.1 hypothetical protein [Moorena sp. SIOASIH]